MKTIVTHNGVFHADDVMAVSIINVIQIKNDVTLNIKRTRNPKEFENADYVIDVGGKYDGEKYFDHHQTLEFKRDNGVEYSSAGLIWKHFGHMAIFYTSDIPILRDKNKKIWNEIDEEIMQPIDMIDNGKADLNNQLTFSHFISSLNPDWNDEQDAENIDDNFYEAVEITANFLIRIIKSKLSSIEAERIVLNSDRLFDNKVIVLEKFCPFIRPIFDNKLDEVLFVCFPDTTGEWRIQAIPPEPKSFKQRKTLPKIWLESKPVEDFIFCHKGLFIAGAKSKESIIKMAKEAVNF